MPSAAHRSTPVSGRPPRAADWLLRAVDGGLGLCILGVPWLMGARHPWGQLVLVLGATLTAAAWMLHQSLNERPGWRHSPAQVFLALGILLLLLQVVPLPPAWIDMVSPRLASLLPLWHSGPQQSAVLGSWSTLSLAPWETRGALALLLAYGMLFLTTVQRVRYCADVERLLSWIALGTVLMAGFGLIQMLAGNGKFFWCYEHPFTTTAGAVKGAFSNRNHLAQFVALGIGPLLWWLYGPVASREDSPRSAAAHSLLSRFWGGREAVLGLVVLAGLLSLSRAGIVVIFLAAAVAVSGLVRAGRLPGRSIAALAGAGVLLTAMLALAGHERVRARLEQLGSWQTMDRSHSRRTIWAAALAAAADYPILGVGVGAHRFVYPVYFSRWHDRDFDHAESGYVQSVEEMGLAGLALILSGMACVGWWCLVGLRGMSRTAGDTADRRDAMDSEPLLKTRADPRMVCCAGAILASLTANAVHSLVDFVWYVPSCMALVAVLAACACRLWQWTVDPQHLQFRSARVPRRACLAACGLVLVVGGWASWNRLGPALAAGHWDRVYALEKQLPDENLIGLESKRESLAQSLAVQRLQTAELEQLVSRDPRDARARLRLAGAYLRQFYLCQQDAPNALPLNQLRDAALGSNFPTVEALRDWLSRAVGPNCSLLERGLEETRFALALCPLQGRGYLYLSELAFVEGAREMATEVLLDQALRVRPHDPATLFQAGTEAWLAGDAGTAFDFWRRAFHSGPVFKKKIVQWFAGRALPDQIEVEIQSLVENLQPDLEGLRLLHTRYRQLAGPEQLAWLRWQYLAALEHNAASRNGSEASQLWLEAETVWRVVGDPERAWRCAENALQQDASSHPARVSLARHLLQRGQFAAAEEHVRWCLQRRPADRELRQMLERSVKGRIETQSQAAVMEQTWK